MKPSDHESYQIEIRKLVPPERWRGRWHSGAWRWEVAVRWIDASGTQRVSSLWYDRHPNSREVGKALRGAMRRRHLIDRRIERDAIAERAAAGGAP